MKMAWKSEIPSLQSKCVPHPRQCDQASHCACLRWGERFPLKLSAARSSGETAFFSGLGLLKGIVLCKGIGFCLLMFHTMLRKAVGL